MSETTASGQPYLVKSPIMAAIVGLTERRLTQLAAEGMPKAGRNGYPLAATVQWIIEYWRKRATQTPLGDARRRKLEADADSAEIDLALKRDRVADIDTIARVHAAACAQIRTRLRAIPSRVAPQLHRQKTIALTEAYLLREIDEALEGLISDLAAKAEG